MSRALSRCTVTCFGLALTILLAAGASAQQSVPLLWKDPGDIAAKDLRWGVGSAERQPSPPFTFVEEDESGSKPKIRVTDAKGVRWNVKFGGTQRDKNEVHPEIAATRIVSALGYFVEEDYYVPQGRVERVRRLGRASSAVGRDGSFRIARFQRRDENVERIKKYWSVGSSPFAETKELSGLKIVLALVNNWDNKLENSGIDQVTSPDGTVELRYLITDWGASFGRMSGPPAWTPAPTRWRIEHFKSEPLVKGVGDGVVKLHFAGQVGIDSVPIEHAKWLADLASQLSVDQVRGAFEAAGATPDEAQAFASRLLEKVQELRAAVSSTTH